MNTHLHEILVAVVSQFWCFSELQLRDRPPGAWKNDHFSSRVTSCDEKSLTRDLRFEIKPLLAHKLTFESRNKHHRLLAPCVLVTEHSRHSQQPRNIGFHHIVWSWSKNRCSPRSSLLLFGCLSEIQWNYWRLLKEKIRWQRKAGLYREVIRTHWHPRTNRV